jgi:hypothetical protein
MLLGACRYTDVLPPMKTYSAVEYEKYVGCVVRLGAMNERQ